MKRLALRGALTREVRQRGRQDHRYVRGLEAIGTKDFAAVLAANQATGRSSSSPRQR